MKTSTFIHNDFSIAGPARMLMYDADLPTAGYMHFPRVSDVSFVAEMEKKTKTIMVRGMRQEVESRTTAVRGRLRMTLMEDLSPHQHKLLFASAGQTQTIEQAEDVVAHVEATPILSGTDEWIVAFERGIAQASNLPLPASITGTAGAAGSLATNDYFIHVAAGFGTKPGSVVATDIDRLWIHSAWTSKAAAISVTGPTGSISGTFAAPASGPTPDFYVIACGLTAAPAAGTHIVSFEDIAGAFTVITSIAGGYDYTGAAVPDYYYPVEITGYNPATSTARTPDTDVEFDLNTGTLKRKSAGSFVDGHPCEITYWVIESPNVATDLGAVNATNDYRQMKLVCLEGHDGSLAAEDQRPSGLVFDFDKVNKSLASGEVGFSEEDWHRGSTVEFDCVYDPSTSRIGVVTAYTPLASKWISAYK